MEGENITNSSPEEKSPKQWNENMESKRESIQLRESKLELSWGTGRIIKASCQSENLQKLVRSMCHSQIDQRLREEVSQDDSDYIINSRRAGTWLIMNMIHKGHTVWQSRLKVKFKKYSGLCWPPPALPYCKALLTFSSLQQIQNVKTRDSTMSQYKISKAKRTARGPRRWFIKSTA